MATDTRSRARERRPLDGSVLAHADPVRLRHLPMGSGWPQEQTAAKGEVMSKDRARMPTFIIGKYYRTRSGEKALHVLRYNGLDLIFPLTFKLPSGLRITTTSTGRYLGHYKSSADIVGVWREQAEHRKCTQ
jgi:hypothetical protein